MVCNLMYEVDKLIKLSSIQLVISNVVKIIFFNQRAKMEMIESIEGMLQTECAKRPEN